jgi:formyl-CoA transferase
MGILSGLRIIDFSQTAAGAFCTKLLSDMGVEVIKIDPPAGKGTANSSYNNITSEYLAAMRGKRSVMMDIEQPANKPFLDGLIKISDGIVESFAPGYMKKYGFSYEDAAALKNDICYLSITGFGQYGPYAQASVQRYGYTGAQRPDDHHREPDGSPMRAGTDLAEEFAVCSLLSEWSGCSVISFAQVRAIILILRNWTA